MQSFALCSLHSRLFGLPESLELLPDGLARDNEWSNFYAGLHRLAEHVGIFVDRALQSAYGSFVLSNVDAQFIQQFAFKRLREKFLQLLSLLLTLVARSFEYPGAFA